MLSVIFLISLFKAAKSGDNISLERCFGFRSRSNMAACNLLDQFEMSPLHYAVKYNHIKIIKTLINNGAGKCLHNEM